ncbi:DapH/DapD/GlmU-related protein [Rhodococcus sp. IEGM 1379]|uniref:DapH/DapD/GlmU-related protein n=1 Tax=Rhodococcus sp. IEGM 1379 TaxID=3047086 RepID=UPI0024B65CF4|nr:DapH/DapD/GlmU-related protein [Rhodococcus sp. IEGM 1379]MDI9916206.1 DapH/DapD/GlmU-related protein [Rhodococcus sp. IEGM 1379]
MPIGKNCQIHPTALIGADVSIGTSVTIGPNAVLTGPLEIGDDCWIGAGVVLGAPPEILGALHPISWSVSAGLGIRIGARTTIRELSTVHQGSERRTEIGDECFLMNRVGIEHDVQVGNRCVVSSGTTLAGHVSVGDGVNLGMHTVAHQRRVIGSGSMIGMGTVVVKDVPPFSKAFGNPVSLQGVNRIGMSRSGISEEDISAVAAIYAAGTFEGLSTIPASLQEAFTWWRERADKPLVS